MYEEKVQKMKERNKEGKVNKNENSQMIKSNIQVRFLLVGMPTFFYFSLIFCLRCI